MQRFRRMKPLQKFASIRTNGHNQFSSQPHLIDRQIYNTAHSATLAELQFLAA